MSGAAVSAAPRLGRTRVSPGHAVKDTAVIMRRNLLRIVRMPQLLLFATVQPVMFLVLFNYVFGGAVGRSIPAAAGGDYLNWLLPGVLLQMAAFGSTQTAMGLIEDLNNGVIDRFRSLPMARSAVLAGRTVADLVRNVFVIALVLGLGYVLGFRPQTSLVSLAGGLLVAMIFGYVLSWGMACIGLAVKNSEAAQPAAMIPMFPLVFASSVFVPTETLPDWLRAFADHQPVTRTANAVRGLILGEGALAPTQTLAGEVTAALLWAPRRWPYASTAARSACAPRPSPSAPLLAHPTFQRCRDGRLGEPEHFRVLFRAWQRRLSRLSSTPTKS